MWYIGETICIFNNKLQSISFKNSFIQKNEKGLKMIHNPFKSNIVGSSYCIRTQSHKPHISHMDEIVYVDFDFTHHL
jgi:hypothetical protein